MYRLFCPLSTVLSASAWPSDFLLPNSDDFLDKVYVVEHAEVATPASLQLQMRVVFKKDDLAFHLPGVFGFKLSFTGSKNESKDDTASQKQGLYEDQGQDHDFNYDDDELGHSWIELAFTLSVSTQGWELALHNVEFELEIPPKV